MLDNDSRPTISVAISVDDDCLVPVSITVPVSIDNDCLAAIAVSIPVSMDRHSIRSYANADFVGQYRRDGANARDGTYNKGYTDH
jgi:hypothetical protein